MSTPHEVSLKMIFLSQNYQFKKVRRISHVNFATLLLRHKVRARGRTGGSSSLSSNNRSMSVQGCGTGANLLPDPNSSEIGNVHGGGGGGGSSFGGSNTTLSSSASSANIIVTGVDGGGGGVGGGMGMGGRRSATPSSLSAVAVVQPDGSSTHSAQSKASTESLQ